MGGSVARPERPRRTVLRLGSAREVEPIPSRGYRRGIGGQPCSGSPGQERGQDMGRNEVAGCTPMHYDGVRARSY